MANYYVSKTNGNDSTGTGAIGAPWATIQHALDQTPGAGDTVWIAPGVYYETVTLASGGDLGDELKIRGDPDLSEAWLNESPGQIVVTCARETDETDGAANTLGSGVAFDFSTYENVWAYDIQGQGGSGAAIATGTAFYGRAANSNQKTIRCVGIGAYSGHAYLDCEYSASISGYACFYQCRDVSTTALIRNGSCKNCVAIGGYYGYYACDADNCISVGSYRGQESSTTRNCTFIANYYASHTASAGSDNNLVLAPYYGGTNANADSSVLIAPYYDSAGNNDLSDCRQIWARTQNALAGNAAGAAHILEFPPAMQVIRGLSKALKPEIYRDYDMSNGSGATSETTDIEGRTRTCYGEVKTAGPWAIGSKELTKHATYGTTLKVTSNGEEVFYLPVEANRPVTVVVGIICSHPGTADTWPSVTLSGDGFTNSTDTATATTDTLTVSATPTRNEVAKVILKANDTETSHYTQFHSIQVS